MYQVAQQTQQENNHQIQLSGAKQKLTDMFVSAGIEAILPSHISMDQFVQVAAIAYMKEPKLQEATKETVMMAFSECAKDGLIPNGKEAFINCYRKNKGTRQKPHYVMIAEYQPMIEGVLKRARNSGLVDFIDVGIVYKEETFEHWTGIEGKHFKHIPRYDIDRSIENIHLFYGIAKLSSGEVKVEVMSRDDVDRVRDISLAKNSGPWGSWYDRMGLKAVGHRLCRQLPKGSELVAMLEKGDEKDFNNEIDITPTADHQALPSPQETSVDALMGSPVTTHQTVDANVATIEHKPSGESNVESLMGGDQSTTNLGTYNKLEELIMGIGSTCDRNKTISEYKETVEKVKEASNGNMISVEQANTLNEMLTSVHQAIRGNR